MNFTFPHQILHTTLVTDEKWPLSPFCISYQNLEISWWKMPVSNFQSHFSRSKISQSFSIPFFNNKLEDQLLFYDFFERNYLQILYFLQTCSFFVSWFPSFGKIYESDLRVILRRWLKLCAYSRGLHINRLLGLCQSSSLIGLGFGHLIFWLKYLALM